MGGEELAERDKYPLSFQISFMSLCVCEDVVDGWIGVGEWYTGGGDGGAGRGVKSDWASILLCVNEEHSFIE